MRNKDFFPKAQVTAENSDKENENSSRGLISVKLELDADISGEYTFAYCIKKEGIEIMTRTVMGALEASEQSLSHELAIDDIELWWPNNEGAQPLYELELKISREGKLCDFSSKRIGFRTVEFVKNEHSPEAPLHTHC